MIEIDKSGYKTILSQEGQFTDHNNKITLAVLEKNKTQSIGLEINQEKIFIKLNDNELKVQIPGLGIQIHIPSEIIFRKTLPSHQTLEK